MPLDGTGPNHRSWQPPLALATACVLWGSAFYFGKLALAELSPLEVTAWRFGLAAPVLVLMLVRTKHHLTSGDVRLIVLTGVLCVPVGYVVHFEGLERTTATHAALLVGIGPPLLAVSASLLGLERLSRPDWLAVGLSCVGVAVMVGAPGSGGDFVGDVLVVVSMLIATGWVLLGQRLTRRLGAVVATSWILLTGTVALAPVLVLTGAPPVDLSPQTWGALAALSLGSTIGAFLLWNWGAGLLPAGRAGVFLNLEPVAGAALGVILLGDTLGVSLLAGGGVVLLASVLASLGSGVDHVPELHDRPPVAGGGGDPQVSLDLAGQLRPPQSVRRVQVEDPVAEMETLGVGGCAG